MQKSSIKKLAGVTVAVIVGASFASIDAKAAEQQFISIGTGGVTGVY